jgi:thiol-disulfide isomerase/thioredoxin
VRLLVVAVLLALLAGCSPSTVDTSAPAAPAGSSCLPPVPSAPEASSAAPGGAAPGRIPDLTLDCFQGGGRVRLTTLHRPAILNLWASWCGPCRTELPEFQSYATRAGDRVLVLGIDTGDTHDAGAGLLQDTRVAFPTLFDAKSRLLSGVGRSALPVTLFVDADGGLRYVYNDKALDEAAIARLAGTHLGITA